MSPLDTQLKSELHNLHSLKLRHFSEDAIAQLQELKSKAEENEDDNYDSMLKNSETNDKNNEKNKSDLEEKIKFLTERN